MCICMCVFVYACAYKIVCLCMWCMSIYGLFHCFSLGGVFVDTCAYKSMYMWCI